MKFFLCVVIIAQAVSSLHGVEIELRNNDVVDIEILFPNKDNPLNTVPQTPEQKEKSARLISFLDRLLNRNQGSSSSGSGTNNAGSATSSSVSATTQRSNLGSLLFIPDVTKAVDTILGGVATGNLEQIISGSFIFTPSRVQEVANGVINRVFGGPSISTINNPNQANNQATSNNNNNNNNNRIVSSNNNVNKNTQQSNVITGSLVDAVNALRTTTPASGGWFSGIFGSWSNDGQNASGKKGSNSTRSNVTDQDAAGSTGAPAHVHNF